MDGLPATPYEARSFRSLTVSCSPSKNGSSEMRHPSAAEGKKTHLLPRPKRDDPSRRPVTVSRYRSRTFQFILPRYDSIAQRSLLFCGVPGTRADAMSLKPFTSVTKSLPDRLVRSVVLVC